MFTRLWYFLFGEARCTSCGGAPSQRRTVVVDGRFSRLQLCCPSTFHDARWRNQGYFIENKTRGRVDNSRAR